MKQLLAFTLCVFSILLTQAQPGTLDKSYGNNGLVYNIAPQSFTEVSAIQADNKIIVGGALNMIDNIYRLLRYNADGTLDTSFGNKGIADVMLPDSYNGPTYGWTAVQVMPDGKIVAAGYLLKYDYNNYPPYDGDMVLARFNVNGTIDATFGNNGVVITDFGEYETIEAMVLQPDGKIVTTGIYSVYGLGYDTKVLTVRYNENGSLDKSFGGKGYVIYNDLNTYANALTLQEDSKIVIAGSWFAFDWCMLLRYMPDGSLDNSFGTGGRVSTQVGVPNGWEQFYTVTIDKQQRIIAAGVSGDNLMGIARYNTDGTPDNSFDEDGQRTMTFNAEGFDEAKKVLLLKDERILIAGNSDGNLVLACLQLNGAFDSTFGTNGATITDFGGDESFKSAVLQQDGKIVVLGSNGTPFLARYNGYDPNKQPLAIRIKRWLQHHGISWQPNPNVRYYSVQKSSDGIIYKEVAKVNSKANSYEDATAAGAGNYYRLVAAAKDGSRTYSNTILIDEAQSARIFPNPVRDNLQLQGLPTTGKTNLSVMDLNGNVRSTSTATGSNYSVSTANLSSGSYLLKIQHNGTTVTQPFVKE